ncbi:hypothetical protein BaRGS_00040185 [Batillaria attramentaria]|uniref:Uncharacterized protein n=1 Tax=Batillaria attramentaria TaxID=370345 RepID=A0ABD0J151_9CAEN
MPFSLAAFTTTTPKSSVSTLPSDTPICRHNPPTREKQAFCPQPLARYIASPRYAKSCSVHSDRFAHLHSRTTYAVLNIPCTQNGSKKTSAYIPMVHLMISTDKSYRELQRSTWEQRNTRNALCIPLACFAG